MALTHKKVWFLQIFVLICLILKIYKVKTVFYPVFSSAFSVFVSPSLKFTMWFYDQFVVLVIYANFGGHVCINWAPGNNLCRYAEIASSFSNNLREGNLCIPAEDNIFKMALKILNAVAL